MNNNLSDIEYKNRHEKLYSLFTETYLTFYIWKGLQEKEYEIFFEENKYFWSATMFGLQNTWMTSLAKIYEKSIYSEKGIIISVYALIKQHPNETKIKEVKKIIEDNATVIKNIEIIRHHQLAHNNANHLLNTKKILENFPLTYLEIESLLELSGKILSILSHEEKVGFSFDGFKDSCINDSKLLIRKIEYFSLERKKHLDKFIKGEVNRASFP